MSDAKKCAQCGAELEPGTPEGLCPACLLIRGLETQTAAGVGARFTPPPPSELARYFPQLEILELLGRGGMGVVYKARQKQLDRFVALKILAAPAPGGDPAFAERFAREALALARLSHPNIVAVYDSGRTDGLYYFLMEYVDGMNLRQLLNTAKIAPREALAIVPQICDALQYAHDQGIVHRDIKPENILMDKTGCVKIADFGLAKIIGREADLTLTGTGEIMGTPTYMAPEQVERPQEVDHRADIYSVGVVFYQMLTGELPMGRFAPPSKKVQIDVRLDEVVLRALEKEPDLRWQQASIFKTQVETISQTPLPPQTPEPAPPMGPAVPGAEANERSWQLARQAVGIPAIGMMVLAGLGLLATLLGMIFFVAKPGTDNGFRYDMAGATFLFVPGVLLGMGANAFVMFAANRMRCLRGHSMAVCASILVILQSLGFGFLSLGLIPGGLLGLACGIWALVVLNRMDVKEAFDGNAKKATHISTPHFSRTAIVGACWIPLFFIGLVLVGTLFFVASSKVYQSAAGTSPPATEYISMSPANKAVYISSRQGTPAVAPGQYPAVATNLPPAVMTYTEPAKASVMSRSFPKWLGLLIVLPLALLCLSGPFVTTILGWVAVSQIRRSNGRLYGLGLAVFDGLFYPLLALAGLIAAIFLIVVRLLAGWANRSMDFHGADYFWFPVFLLLTGGCFFCAAFLIVRGVWRGVNRTLDGQRETSEAAPQMPAASPTQDPIARALRLVKIPATGLMVVSAIGVLQIVVYLLALIMKFVGARTHADPGDIDPLFQSVVMTGVMLLVALAINAFIFAATSRMRRLQGHSGAIMAAILVIIQIFLLVCA